MERKAEDARVSPWLDPDERLLWWSVPSAGGLFFANLAGVLTNLVWACATAASIAFAAGARTGPSYAACGIFLLITLGSLARTWRAAFGAGHIFYAITDRRVLSIDDREAAPFIVFRGVSTYNKRDAQLDGPAACGRLRAGRATVKIPYRAFMAGTLRTNDGMKCATLKLVAVTAPDEAVNLLNHHIRR